MELLQAAINLGENVRHETSNGPIFKKKVLWQVTRARDTASADRMLCTAALGHSHADSVDRRG